MKPSNALLSALFVIATILPTVASGDETQKLNGGMISTDHILVPDGTPRANIFLISDADGWDAREQAQAETLLAKGAAVVGIDFPSYLKALRADDGNCVYMISDVESLAHQLQRAAGATSYNLPIVAGVGEGGALALAMIAQSPAATIGEAVAIDPLAGIPLEKVLCTPADKTHAEGRTVYGFVDGNLPSPVTVRLTAAASEEGRRHVDQLLSAHPDVDVQDTDSNPADALAQILADRVDAPGDDGAPLGLPITVLETRPSMDTMAIIYSGDGGWRDIDKQVGGALREMGVPVIGVDSLRYFWSERKPQETADDLARIIEAYRKKWNVHHIVLAGYSFGADVLPATYNLLSQQDKDRVPLLTLMALSRQVDYEVSVEGWLGLSGGNGAGDPVRDIAKIDPAIVQCIYGTDEDEDPCPQLKGVESIAIEGGHHFDGDYKSLAERIVNALKARIARPQ